MRLELFSLRRWLTLMLLLIPAIVLCLFVFEQIFWQRRMFMWQLDEDSRVGSIGAQTSVRFLPDGRTLATGSEDERVRLWNVPSGRLKETITLKRASMPVVSAYVGSPAGLSPDGMLLATLYWADGLKLWDAQTGRHEWSAATTANAVAFSPDSRMLAVYGSTPRDDKTRSIIEVWDVPTRRMTRLRLPKEVDIKAAAFSPEGDFLATVADYPGRERNGSPATPKAEIRIIDARTGSTQQVMPAPSSRMMSVAFSPDGKLLAAGSWDGKVSLLDLQTRKLLRTLKGHTPDNLGASWSVVFSPKSKLLACGGQREVQVWNIPEGILLKRLKLLNTPMTVGDLDVGEVAFSHDGRILAICGKSNRTVTLHRIN